jgi:hypothetical protein
MSACKQVIEDGLTRNNANVVRRRYNLNSIPAIPGVKPRDMEYWKALAEKYPPQEDYFKGNIRKLQLKVVAKLSGHIEVIYDKSDESVLSGLLRVCTDTMCLNIPHKNKTLGSLENRGKLREYMGRHNIMIALLTSDGGAGGINPLGDGGGLGGIHAVTICKEVDPQNPNRELYSVYDSTGYYGMCSMGYRNLANFAGNDVSAKLKHGDILKWLETERGKRYLELSEQLTRSQATHDWGYVAPFLDELTVLLNEYTNIRKVYDNYEDYLFEGTNIVPIKCSLQQSRPTCVFWSMLRALHPEKNLKETQCILDAALEKSGLNSPGSTIPVDERLDLLILHMFEEFVEADDVRSQEQRRINRWVLGGRRTYKRKGRKKRTLKK